MTQPKNYPFYIILLLILAGEAVFVLPFVLARIFRPTFLSAFEINNLELGYCFSVYGIVALLSYLYGGVIADRFKPRKLMATALWLTALGGIVLASYPSLLIMKILYGYWGFTTIFLFWAAMIKATRVWGGTTRQGRAFGFLDGGRGLVAAGIGSLGVLIFALIVPAEQEALNQELRVDAFRYVIWFSSALVFIVGVMVYFFLKLKGDSSEHYRDTFNSTGQIREALKLRSVWLLMIIILCAYFGYKMTDIFSLYAADVMLFSEVDAAKTGTFLLFIRPVVGVVVGFLADRTHATTNLILGFIVGIVGAMIFASGVLGPGMNFAFFGSIFFTAFGIYAARVLYFAVMQQGRIPLALTGTAIGLVSLVGYTPDIFAGPMIGYFLDNSPGELGHQQVFGLLAIFSAIGLLAAIGYHQYARRENSE